MKILHTADWHLGKRLDHVSRLEEQKEVLEEICQIADREEVDAILIAGDLFDQINPSIESLELFYRTLKRLAHDGAHLMILKFASAESGVVQVCGKQSPWCCEKVEQKG